MDSVHRVKVTKTDNVQCLSKTDNTLYPEYVVMGVMNNNMYFMFWTSAAPLLHIYYDIEY